MSGATIAAVIGVMMALVLATRGFRTRGMTGRSMLLVALAWIVIFVLLAFVFQRSGISIAPWRR